MVEEAIRQSLAEHQKQRRLTEEERARASSIREDLQGARGGETSSRTHDSNAESDDEELRKAIEASQQKSQAETEEDLAFARAVEESRKAHEDHTRAQVQEDAVVEYIKQHSLAEGREQN